jgi:hypothetical protein
MSLFADMALELRLNKKSCQAALACVRRARVLFGSLQPHHPIRRRQKACPHSALSLRERWSRSDGYLTVSVAVPVAAPDAAEMTVLPPVTAVALPVVALMVAVAGVPDVQVEELVRSWVEPFE